MRSITALLLGACLGSEFSAMMQGSIVWGLLGIAFIGIGCLIEMNDHFNNWNVKNRMN